MKQFLKITSIFTLTILLLGIVCCAGSPKNEQSALSEERPQVSKQSLDSLRERVEALEGKVAELEGKLSSVQETNVKLNERLSSREENLQNTVVMLEEEIGKEYLEGEKLPKGFEGLAAGISIFITKAFEEGFIEGLEKGEEQPLVKLPEETLEIGQGARNSDIEVAVLRVKRQESYVMGEGKVFLIVTASIKNIGDEIEYAEHDDFSLSDSEGFKYEPGIDTASALWYTKLFPGEKVEGKLFFEVPKTATGLKVSFNFAGMFEKPKLVHWAIR